MPNYSYKCSKCEKITDKLRAVDERNAALKCECGGDCKKLITKPSRVWAPTRNQ